MEVSSLLCSTISSYQKFKPKQNHLKILRLSKLLRLNKNFVNHVNCGAPFIITP